MERLIKAFGNSMRALSRLARREKAFQQELMLFVAALPAGWFLATSWPVYGLLVGSIAVLMIVEVLNTGIEAACDAVTREFDLEIQFAKDCGSLAVLIALLLVVGVWGVVLLQRLGLLA